MSHRVSLGTDVRGNLTRLDTAIAGIPERLERGQEQLENLRSQQAAAQVELTKPVPQEAELAEKSARLAELDAAQHSAWTRASQRMRRKSAGKPVTVSAPPFWRT